MAHPRLLVLVSAALAVAVACRSSTDAPGGTEKAPPSAVTRARVSAPLDIGSIRTRFHFGFRRDDDGSLVAGHASHVVRASARGFSVAPIDLPPPGAASHAPGPASAPLSMDAAAIARGGVAAAGPGDPRIVEDGSVVVPRGPSIDERLANGVHGVEQSFTFARAPAGDGDLVLRMPVHGEAFAAKTSGGLHFRDPATGRGVAYGAATWVDARGARAAVAPAFDGAAIVLRVPAALVGTSAYPATLDPSISPEHGVDQPIFESFGPGVNAAPAIDVEGGRYFAVWADDRASYVNGIFGVHVAQDGAPVETVPITITPGFPPAPGSAPASPEYDSSNVAAVAFDGTNHLVVYTDQRNGHLAISARRVSSAGLVLDPSPIRVSPQMSADASSPSVAFDGTDYVVAWADGRNAPASQSDVFATRVTVGGSVLEASSIPVSRAPGDNTDPKIAAGAAGSLYVVWSADASSPGVSSSAVLGALMTSSGFVVSTDIAVGANAAIRADFLPSVTGWGGGFLVAYLNQPIAEAAPVRNYQPSGAATPIATLVGPDGAPTSSTPDVLPPELPGVVNGVAMFSAPSVAFDGTSFLFVYSTTNALEAQSISTVGTLVGAPSSLAISADERDAPGSAVVAASSSGRLVVAHTSNVNVPDTDEVVAMPVTVGADAGPAIGGPQAISLASSFEVAGGIAYTGSGYLVTWVDGRNELTTQDDIYGVILDANGLGVGGADGGIDAGYPLADAFPIVTTPLGDELPRVACDDAACLVAYVTFGFGAETGPAVCVKRVSFQGQIMGDTAPSAGAGMALLSSAAPLDVAWDGAAFLLAWTGTQGAPDGVIATHVGRTSAGAPGSIEGPVVVSPASGVIDPRVASAGSGAGLIVFRDAASNLIGTFVEDPVTPPPAGALLQIAAGISAHAVTYDTVNGAYRLVFVGSAGDASVGPGGVWVASGQPPSVTSPVLVAKSGVPQIDPAIGFDGVNALAAWSDQRSGPGQLDVYATRVGAAGAPLDVGGFAIAADPTVPEAMPLVAGTGHGAALVAYMKYDVAFGAIRLASRAVTEVSNEGAGASCTTGGDCSSGFCVDGVCCDQQCGANEPTRCAVCSAARGASADGTCTVLVAGSVCRASGGACQLTEVCDGTSSTCPTTLPPDGTLCAAGVCIQGVCVATSDASAPVDAAEDTGSDAPVDAEPDAEADASPPADAAPVDAADDAGEDAAADAGIDAASDAAPPDAGEDAAERDAGVDAAAPPIVVLDASPPSASDGSFAPFSPASGGCGCRAAGDAGGANGWAAAALAMLSCSRRLRRRPRRGSAPRPRG